MGRAFEYRKARKLKRWGNMARTFTRIGKEIDIAVKAGGPDPANNTRLRILIQNAKAENLLPREPDVHIPEYNLISPVQPDGVHNSAPNSVLLLNQENS